MKRDPMSFWRMLACFFIAAIIGGVIQLVFNFVIYNQALWMLVFQVSVITGLIAYLVVTFHEKGIVFTLVVAVLVAVAIGIVGRVIESWVLQAVIVFVFELLFVGLIVLGDLIGQPKRLVRALLGIAGGLVAGILSTGIAGAVNPSVKDFLKGITENLVIIVELGAVPSVALFVTRLLLGEKKTSKPLEEVK